jgi:glyoxylase-like metal-dependent hydrolase (beta-lactamase superfamily II)
MRIETLVVSPFEENCYLVGDEETGDAVVIDPGDEAEFIFETAGKLNFTIKLILCTHGHVDHVGAVEGLKKLTNAEFRMHRADAFLLEHLPGQAALFGVCFSGIPRVDAYLEEGQTISAAGVELRVIHTPGHSPGGLSFFVDSSRFPVPEAEEGKQERGRKAVSAKRKKTGNPRAVFSGDLLFAGSIGRTDLAGGDYSELLNSIRIKLFPLGDDTVVFSGHGPETTIGAERKNNPFLNPIYL